MSDLSIVIALTLALCAVLVWLLIPRHESSKADATLVRGAGIIQALPSARHYAYFPLIRQALSAADARYLMENAPPQVAEQALRERRVVARKFLRGLHEDFSNLVNLGRTIAALSPEVSHEQERARLMLSLRFQILYALVWLRLSSGNLPLQQLEQLTHLVGRLATRMDEAMTKINALSAGPVPGRIGA
jgi:hypothetical protein